MIPFGKFLEFISNCLYQLTNCLAGRTICMLASKSFLACRDEWLCPWRGNVVPVTSLSSLTGQVESCTLYDLFEMLLLQFLLGHVGVLDYIGVCQCYPVFLVVPQHILHTFSSFFLCFSNFIFWINGCSLAILTCPASPMVVFRQLLLVAWSAGYAWPMLCE